ncbi:MarR family winged helix-turn-helix transcriptional regulator [Halogeometricum borinquense]|uniref:MarR family winged helix-turn-helix transcriptional regulator n=1 Tax=Halogeometricum borinquense TaxID=60847 RepID=UPI001EF7A8B6|nr:MarR family winged helix-turn-helix transcriptional regulator [Halogeometricum borinquense]
MSSHTGVTNSGSKLPRAVIHKKILDVAESRPDATVEELSSVVNGASVTLVERVLDEYGDPASTAGVPDEAETGLSTDESEMSKPKTNGSMSKTDTHHVRKVAQDPVDLTEKQREVLRAIQDSPDATQSELADRFGVTQSTINNRLNSIEGFDWKHRQAFTEVMLDDSDTSADDDTSDSASVQNLSEQLTDLSEQVAALEQQLNEPAQEASPFSDPDLVCKIVRACLNSEAISEDEEDRIMKAVLTTGTASEA